MDYFSMKEKILDMVFKEDNIVVLNDNMYVFCGSRNLHHTQNKEDKFIIQATSSIHKNMIWNFCFYENFSWKILFQQYQDFRRMYNRDLAEQKFKDKLENVDVYCIV